MLKLSRVKNEIGKFQQDSLTESLQPVGVEISVIYHTFIETCKMCGVSTLEYFKEFFKAVIKRVKFRIHSRNVEREQVRLIINAIMQGRTDYDKMLPMTIGIKKD